MDNKPLPKLGTIVRYTIPTRFGLFVLPAEIVSWASDNKALLHVYTDDSDADWAVEAHYDEQKTARTWHYA